MGQMVSLPQHAPQKDAWPHGTSTVSGGSQKQMAHSFSSGSPSALRMAQTWRRFVSSASLKGSESLMGLLVVPPVPAVVAGLATI